MIQDPTPTIPDATELGRALASNNDWRAIMIAFIVLTVIFMSSMFAIMVWRERNFSRLSGAIDKVADALWQLKLQVAESTIKAREDRRERKQERADDIAARDTPNV